MSRFRLQKFSQLRLRYKILLGIVVFWLYLFLIGYILLRNQTFREYLKSRIVAEIEKNLNAAVTIGDISGNVFSRIHIRRVRVIGPVRPIPQLQVPGKPVPSQVPKLSIPSTSGELNQNEFTADEVTARFSLWQALHGVLGFSNLQLIKPKLIIHSETLAKSKVGATKAKLYLRWIQIEDATIVVEHLNKTYTVNNLDFAGSVTYDSPNLQLGIRKCSGIFEGIPVDELRGVLRVDPSQIELRNFRVTGSTIQIQANGSITNFLPDEAKTKSGLVYEPIVHVQVLSDRLPIQKLLKVVSLSINLPLSGIAKLHAQLDGPVDNLTGSGELLISQGKYGETPFAGFQMSFSASTGIVRLEKVKTNIFGGTVDAKGELNLTPEKIEMINETKKQVTRDKIQNKNILVPFAANLVPKFTISLTIQNIELDKVSTSRNPSKGIENLFSGKLSGGMELAGNLNNRDTWTGSGQIQWQNGKYKTIPVTVANVDLNLDKGTVYIQKSRLENSDTQMEGTGYIRLNGETQLRLNIQFTQIDSVNRLFNWSGLSGHGTAEIALDGVLPRAPRWSGKFTVADGTYADLKFLSLQGLFRPFAVRNPQSEALGKSSLSRSPALSEGSQTENELQLHWDKLQWLERWSWNGDATLRLLPQNKTRIISATFISGSSQLVCSGEIDFANKRTAVTFSGNKLDVADYPQVQKAIPRVNSQFDVDGTIAGPFNNIIVSGKMNTVTLSANQQLLPKLSGTFTHTIAQKLTKVTVTGAGYVAQGDVLSTSSDPTLQIQVTARSGDIKYLFAWLGIPQVYKSGTINGSATFSGKLSQVAYSGNFQQVEMLFPFESIQNEPESFNRITMNNGVYSGKITGKTGNFQWTAGTMRNMQLNGKTESAIANLDMLKGELSWDEQAVVNGTITANRGLISSVPISTFLTRLNFQNKALNVTECNFATGDGAMSLSGSINWNPVPFSYQFAVHAQNIQLKSVLRYLTGTERLRDSAGLLNATIKGNGSGVKISTITGNGNLELKEIMVFNRKIDNVTAAVEIASRRLQVSSAELRHNHTTASLSGWIDLDQHLNITAKGSTDDLMLWIPPAKGAAQFQLTWTNTLQKPLLHCYLESTKGGYARISWEKAVADGELTDKLQGIIKFNGDRIILGTQRFDRTTATINLNDPVIELTQLTAIQKEGISQAQGKINLNTGDMQLAVEGKKLDFLSLIFGGTQPPSYWESGEVNLQGMFIGNYKQHTATTKISKIQIDSKQKGAVTPKFSLKNEQEITVTWKNTRIDIPETKFTDGKGEFTVQGNVLLTVDYHPQYYDFSLTGTNVTWPVLRGLNAIYNPKLTLRGDSTELKLSGDIPVLKAEINGPILFAPPPSNIPMLKPTAANLQKSPLALALKFETIDKLHLKTNIVDVDGKGWIQLTGPANEPSINYEFQSVSGVVTFRGYRFEITKADAKPIESSGFNPLMDLYAQKKIKMTDVYLRFYGTVQNYEITLTSDPPMEQSGIFSLLATGRTTEELKSGNINSDRIAYELAAGYIGEEVLSSVGGPIMKSVGIDRIGVDYETSTDPRLKLEKDVGKKITASYSMGVTRYPDPQAKLELGLGKHLSLIGTVGTNSLTQTATSAVDLELKFHTK